MRVDEKRRSEGEKKRGKKTRQELRKEEKGSTKEALCAAGAIKEDKEDKERELRESGQRRTQNGGRKRER